MSKQVKKLYTKRVERFSVHPFEAKQLIIGRSIAVQPALLEKMKHSNAAQNLLRVYYSIDVGITCPMTLFHITLLEPLKTIRGEPLLDWNGLPLKKDSVLFENECSIYLAAAQIFLPGAFPWDEVWAYRELGRAFLKY